MLPTAGIVAAFSIFIYIAGIFESWRLDRMAQTRLSESICQFARYFRGPDFDPVLVRAVYESTQELSGRADVPIRPADRFSEEFGIVDEDLDDLAADVASLAYRSFEHTDRNPLYGQVRTIADLIRFLQHQPRLTR